MHWAIEKPRQFHDKRPGWQIAERSIANARNVELKKSQFATMRAKRAIKLRMKENFTPRN